MIDAIIIEDEPQAISALKQELALNCPEVFVKDTAQSVKEGISKIQKNNPALIFLDIQLSDGLGLDILDFFKEINFKIIITTAYSNYALQAIKFSALDYLLKPINSKELQQAVAKVMNEQQQFLNKKISNYIQNEQHVLNKKIVLQTSEGYFIHEISTIIKCNSKGNYTQIYFTNNKRILISKTLKEFEDLLVSFNFERIHHSFLINLSHLKSYINKDGGYVVMSDNSTIPVSQRKKAAFIKRLDLFSKL
jgi:two-component system LytT family response regulator